MRESAATAVLRGAATTSALRLLAGRERGRCRSRAALIALEITACRRPVWHRAVQGEAQFF